MDSNDDGPPYWWLKSRERDPQPISLSPLPPISQELPPSLSLLPLADVPVIVERDPPLTSLPGLSTSPQLPPSSSSLLFEAMAIDRLDHQERDGHNSQCDIISVNPFAPIVEPPPEPQSLEELLYFRYGYSLDEILDRPMPSFSQHNSEHFNTWTKICQSVGGQTFESSAVTSNFESIQEFLVALETTGDQPLHAVPAKFWDLSPWNSNPLTSGKLITT
jgi:hypothetical protein